MRTQLAATEWRFFCPHGDPSFWESGDFPDWCSDRALREERFSLEPGSFFVPDDFLSVPSQTWFPYDPEWVQEMSWLQRNLVDVYAVYGALVMGVGLLMKLTWNLVW